MIIQHGSVLYTNWLVEQHPKIWHTLYSTSITLESIDLFPILIIIIIIIGATGTISKSFRKYMSNIPRKYEVKELHETAMLGTAHILQKALM